MTNDQRLMTRQHDKSRRIIIIIISSSLHMYSANRKHVDRPALYMKEAPLATGITMAAEPRRRGNDDANDRIPVLGTEDEFRIICQRLEQNDETLTVLSFLHPLILGDYGSRIIRYMDDSMARRLAVALEGNTCVTELYLDIRNLSVRGAIALMPYLQQSAGRLDILSLRGDYRLDTFDHPSQPAVIDVLVRGVLACKKACLELHSCPIAVSTLLTLFCCSDSQQESPSPCCQLGEVSMAAPCMLIYDQSDSESIRTLLHGKSLSPTIRTITIHPSPDADGVLRTETPIPKHRIDVWMLQLASRLPSLETLYIRDAIHDTLPWKCLLQNCCKHSLREVVFHCRLGFINFNIDRTLPLVKFWEYVGKADYLERLSVQLHPLLMVQTLDEARAAILSNYSIGILQWRHNSQDEISSAERHIRRNRDILSHWCDLEVDIPHLLWPQVIERVAKTRRGRLALYERIGTMFAASADEK